MHPIFEFIGEMFRGPTFDIEEQSRRCLRLRYGRTRMVFDQDFLMVMRDGSAVAAFASISSVEISRSRSSDRPERWVVRLILHEGRTVFVGSVLEDVQASIVAARIATITGHGVTFES